TDPTPGPTAVDPSFSVDGVIRDLELQVVAGAETVKVSAEKANLTLGSIQQALKFSLNATLSQSEPIGKLEAEGRIKKLFAEDGQIRPDEAVPSVAFKAEGVPGGLIDRLAAAGGRLAELLGHRVNLTTKLDQASGSLAVSVQIDSSRLEAEADGTWSGGVWRLTGPATARGVLSPELFAMLRPEDRLMLSEPFRWTLDAETFTAQLNDGRLDLPTLAAKAQLRATDTITLHDRVAGKLNLKNLTASVSTASLSEILDGSISAEVDLDQKAGTLSVTGSAARLLDSSGRLNLKAVEADVAARLGNIPASLLSLLAADTRQLGQMLLGPKVHDLELKVTGSSQQKMDLSVRLDSSNLQTGEDQPIVVELTGRVFKLKKPAKIRWKTAEAAEALSRILPGAWAVKTDGPLLAEVRSAQLELDQQNRLRPDRSGLEATLSGKTLRLDGFYLDRRYRLEDPVLTLGGESLERLTVALRTEGVFSRPGLGGELFSRRASVQASAAVQLD
ncbi:MAG: hypothetical protein R3236_12070, partial [Phycisphaeraceae bacterium]|nr:hypothetical protein [Phycisphaeraceae bacterium]